MSTGLLLVGIGAVIRAAGPGAPAEPDRSGFFWFVGVLWALSLLAAIPRGGLIPAPGRAGPAFGRAVRALLRRPNRWSRRGPSLPGLQGRQRDSKQSLPQPPTWQLSGASQTMPWQHGSSRPPQGGQPGASTISPRQ